MAVTVKRNIKGIYGETEKWKSYSAKGRGGVRRCGGL